MPYATSWLFHQSPAEVAVGIFEAVDFLKNQKCPWALVESKSSNAGDKENEVCLRIEDI